MIVYTNFVYDNNNYPILSSKQLVCPVLMDSHVVRRFGMCVFAPSQESTPAVPGDLKLYAWQRKKRVRRPWRYCKAAKKIDFKPQSQAAAIKKK